MQIITVAPIVRGVLKERLSYFSKEPLEVGMAIIVPVRSREIPAIVLETKNVSDEKSTIKSSEYSIRKISRSHARRIWTTPFLAAVQETANLAAQKFGESLLTLTPKTVLDAYLSGDLPEPLLYFHEQRTKRAPVLAIQGDTKTRLEEIERLVRESFARDESVFICLPTADDVMRVKEKLERGISNYTYAFSGNVSKKKMLETWSSAIAEKHATLVIGTAQFLGMPRYFKTIVLDEEHSPSWKTVARPLIDLRLFIESYAQTAGSTLILSAPLLRMETHARVREGLIEEFGRIASRTYTAIDTEIVDPRVEEKAIHEYTGKHSVVLLSTKIRAVLEEAQEKRQSTLLISARKGLSPVTSCADCGALIRCPECDTPLVIHPQKSTGPGKGTQGSEAHVFICHGCGYMRVPEDNVHETCPNCGGWRLQGVGIGINRIEEELKKYFPNTQRFVLDSEHAKTKTAVKKLIQQFQKTPGSVLIATPAAISQLESVDNAIIVSIDSLFAIPDIRMPERIFTFILALREKTKNSLIVQTRADDITIFSQALSGDLAQFIDHELAIRKMFSYPPYGSIIKLTVREKRSEITKTIDHCKVFLEDYLPIVSGAMAKEPNGIFKMHMILKLSKNSWPNKELLGKLLALPNQITIEVNPNSLL